MLSAKFAESWVKFSFNLADKAGATISGSVTPMAPQGVKAPASKSTGVRFRVVCVADLPVIQQFPGFATKVGLPRIFFSK